MKNEEAINPISFPTWVMKSLSISQSADETSCPASTRREAVCNSQLWDHILMHMSHHIWITWFFKETSCNVTLLVPKIWSCNALSHLQLGSWYDISNVKNRVVGWRMCSSVFIWIQDISFRFSFNLIWSLMLISALKRLFKELLCIMVIGWLIFPLQNLFLYFF